ncbi:putative acetyltransferase YhhY [compost metagenome]
MLITRIELSDAADFLKMQLQLDKETKYMMYESGERLNQVQPVKEMIQHFHSSGSLLALARTRKEIAGFIGAKRGNCNRTIHSAHVVIGVLSKYQGQGTGKRLMLHLNEWAMSNKITRLELTVMAHNERAIALYTYSGFKQEGIKKNSMLVDGKYVDEFYMAKLF